MQPALRWSSPLAVVLALVACGGATTPARAPSTSTGGTAPTCLTSPGDDACDVCTAAKCCPEETACMTDSACKAADDALDACEAKAEKAGSGLPECYDAFGANGAVAKTRAQCIRSNCPKECVSP